MSVFTLSTPIRTAADPEFTTFLDTIGEDTSGRTVDCSFLPTVSSIEDAILFLFPPDVLANPELCMQRAFISPRNYFVDLFNIHLLDILAGDEQVNYSSDAIKEIDEIPATNPEYSPEYLAQINSPNSPPHRLDLKVGAVCAVQRNMSVEKGLVKNARISIVAMHHRFIEVKVVGRNDIHCLPRITFEFKPHHGKFTICRRQLPLKLAYATTFNGCQGLDLQKTIIDLRTDVFAHGQLYTALS